MGGPLAAHGGNLAAAAAAAGLPPLPSAAAGQLEFLLHQELQQQHHHQQKQQQLLQQASNNAGNGDFLSLTQTLAAAGLLGLPPFSASGGAPAAGSSLSALQNLGGLPALGAFDALSSLQALHSMNALQGLSSLGALPGSLGLPGGAALPAAAQWQPSLSALQQQVAAQQAAAAAAGARAGGGGAGASVDAERERRDQELLQQLQRMNDACAGISQSAAGQAPGSAPVAPAAAPASAAPATRGSGGSATAATAPRMPSQPAAAAAAAAAGPPPVFDFEALLQAQQKAVQQVAQAAGAAGSSQPAPFALPPSTQQAVQKKKKAKAAGGRARPQRRKAAGGKAAAPELPPDVAAALAACDPATAAALPPLPSPALPGAVGAAAASLPPPALGQLEGQQQAALLLSSGDAGAGGQTDSGDEAAGMEGVEGGEGDARLAEARRKNREAQQRFRERQRAAVREAEVKYEQVLDQVGRLRLENIELEQRNRVMMAALGVRDSMLLAFSLGQCSGAASDSRGGAAAAAHGAGMAALDTATAPAGEQKSAPAAALAEAGARGGGGQGVDARGASAAAAAPGAGADAGSPSAAAAAALVVAGVLGRSPRFAGTARSGSEVIEEVEPASHGMLDEPVALRTARELATPEDYTAYYQQSQVEMKFALQMCREGGMAEEDKKAVEGTHRLMQDVWQQSMRLFPNHVKTFMRDLSAPDGTEGERWEALAAKVELSEVDLHLLFRGYRRFLKQSSRIAQDRQHLQGQLQQALAAHERLLAAGAAWPRQLTMHAQAAAALEVLDVAQGLDSLAEHEFHLIMDFGLLHSNVLGQFQMAMINAEAAPFVPNFLEIARRELRLAAESGRLISSGGASLTFKEIEKLAPGEEQEEEEEEEEEELQAPAGAPAAVAGPSDRAAAEALVREAVAGIRRDAAAPGTQACSAHKGGEGSAGSCGGPASSLPAAAPAVIAAAAACT
ncbi:hypothetical protein CHLNCDRAFT_136809 [Chlorella variabilis]|uniref:BZIP domain-containing protein n=1 Tax=Chlorella variabilis TaxID=554065 RepID=E1ZL42_CHLVA|nr:hypothetical protein CHLNCDRAFT_136809 [Chlorella variabilis]EFN53496.1 hypothetical protein CHLNCDRAFT_136809 [Chlorella variabilis]|eukprot:XP_005845598.1 hypothetical protein CHLNCDRAFT_136809 [Chlorella variabilis]